MPVLSNTVSCYIEKRWDKCAKAKTVELTEKYSEIIDNLYNVLEDVSKYEHSLIATLSVD